MRRAGAPKKRGPPKIDPNAPFELSTPMLVMLFERFKDQGRIEKNVVAWRKKASEMGLDLVPGLIESTRLNQEMDQLYRYYKQVGSRVSHLSHT